METLYSSAMVCVSTRGCDLELDPGILLKLINEICKLTNFIADLDDIMATSKNYSELEETWINWRNAAGKPARTNYITYFTLGNKAAKMNELPNKSNL